MGAEANRIKEALQAALKARDAKMTSDAEAAGASPEAGAWAEDLTLPARHRWRGGVHPVSQVIDDIWRIFQSMGFVRARGPEADTEWYNFVALNTPLDHPAADEQDTLYLKDSVLLRSHTSPVQVRTMEKYEPPICILAPGMVYRRDSYDATHTPAFAQIEGLVVDEGITFVDLKATLAEFARRFWGEGASVRFRPSFFPFTEPSAEVDVKRIITMKDGDPSRVRLDRDHGRGHGGSERPGERGLRREALHGLRLRHGSGSDRSAQVWRARPPHVFSERRALPFAVHEFAVRYKGKRTVNISYAWLKSVAPGLTESPESWRNASPFWGRPSRRSPRCPPASRG